MKKLLSILIILTICVVSFCVYAQSDTTIQKIADYVYNTVQNPTVAAVGGEWAIIGLIRSETGHWEEYCKNYYKNVENHVKKCNGILHDKKYTEYSRLVLALTAIGKNPSDIAGYNLLTPLGDFEKTIWQGVNGAAWALIALDCGNYEIPRNSQATVQATRELYISHLLENQKADGGWALSKNAQVSDADITGMVLQSLAKYKDKAEVKEAIEKALLWISKNQTQSGGFSFYGAETSESAVQIIVGLCALGISCDDERFVKNGNSLLDYLMTYRHADGGFMHIKGADSSNLMATEQVLYALCAVERMKNGKSFIYDMTDVIKTEEIIVPETEEETLGDKIFDDIKGHKNEEAIRALSSRGIINGKSETAFDPENTMTRAEFATIIVKALDLKQKGTAPFTDVEEKDWFYFYVNAAYENGVINGIGEGLFNPYGTITRQEAAVMIDRSAKILGKDNYLNQMASRDILAMYTDYVKTAPWAINSLAFCVDTGIIEEEELTISPMRQIKRGETAQMIYNLLEEAY